MSQVTEIKGWIETGSDCSGIIRNFKGYTDNEGSFPRMFCVPKEMGMRSPHYVVYGASINYCYLEEEFIPKFQELLSEIIGGRLAVLFIDEDEKDPHIRIWNYVNNDESWLEVVFDASFTNGVFEMLFEARNINWKEIRRKRDE